MPWAWPAESDALPPGSHRRPDVHTAAVRVSKMTNALNAACSQFLDFGVIQTGFKTKFRNDFIELNAAILNSLVTDGPCNCNQLLARAMSAMLNSLETQCDH
jgi:hypothetical protein